MIETIKRAVAEMMSLQAKTQYGTITAYNPNRHNVKVMLQPEGTETGWIPLTSMWVGPNMGAVFGPMIGTACRVDFAGGDPQASIAGGRVFDAKNAPPVVQSGQGAIVDSAGSWVKLNADGTITLSASVGITSTTPLLKQVGNLEVDGNIVATQDISDKNGTKGTVQHIRDNYDVHTHNNVQPGSSNTGTPNNTL